MLFQKLLILASVAEAHFRIPFPGERNATNWDTQLTRPCGGDNTTVLPRFSWNPNGSPIDLNIHHTKSVGAIYFCPGNECSEQSDFSELIYEPFQMETAANYCIPALTLPSQYNTQGQNGTLQVIFAGNDEDHSSGYNHMYNCVDIVVDSAGPTYNGSQCSNSSSISVYFESRIDAEVSSTRFDSISTYTILDAARSSAANASSSSSMDMAGMSGMDMGSSSVSGGGTLTSQDGSTIAGSAVMTMSNGMTMAWSQMYGGSQNTSSSGSAATATANTTSSSSAAAPFNKVVDTSLAGLVELFLVLLM